MTLKIYLLGQFKLQHDTETIELPSRPAQSLLAYLAINAGIPHRREKLAGLLWPDSTEENARGYLRQALWRIKKSLEEHGLVAEDLLSADKINICFLKQADYWLDTQELLRKTDSLSPEELSSILKQYQGELLPGFYDEWVSPEREHLAAAFQQKIAQLLEALIEQQRWEDVLVWAEDWIRLAPVSEAAYRALMRAHAACGDRAMLTATYARCQKALDADLGVEISAETTALLDELTRQIRKPGRAKAVPRTEAIATPPAFLNDQLRVPAEPTLFVARAAELQTLSGHLQDALAGHGKVVFITGEAGSGKTALLDAFTRAALEQHAELIAASGHGNAQTGVGDPYLPMRELIGMLAGDFEARLEAGTLALDHAKRLWNHLPAVVDALETIGPDLLDTFIPSKPFFERANYYPDVQRKAFARLKTRLEEKLPIRSVLGSQQIDLFEQYTRVLIEISNTAPLLLVLDDLQWADDGSIRLLFHLGREIAHHPVLIIGAFRQEEIALGRDSDRHPLEPLINEFQRMFGVRTINLERSDQEDFIDALLDSEPNHLDRSFREKLYRQTLGHPLFTIELLRAMQESGGLEYDDSGRWVVGSDLDWDRMPARVEAVVAERIERLSPSAKTILQAASVEGELFTAEVLSQVLKIDEDKLLESLNVELDHTHRLIRSASIERIGGQLFSRYQFRHATFQKYLYSSLNEIELVHLHQKTGSALEALSEKLEDKSSLELPLARHFELAGIPEKAIDHYHRAGNRAILLSGYAEGIGSLQKALKLLLLQPESRERSEKELALQLSVAMSWKYNWTSLEGSDTIDRIRYLCAQLDRTSPLARICAELSTYYYVQAEYGQSLDYALESLEIARKVDDPLLIAIADWHIGYLHFGLGNYQGALDHLRRVDEFYNPDLHHYPLLELCGVDAGLSARSYQACTWWSLGYPDRAMKIGQSTIALARSFSHPFTIADVLSYAGCLLYTLLGDADSLVEYADELVDLSTEVSLSLSGWVGLSRCFLGEALTTKGDLDQAIAAIEVGLAESRATGVKLYLPMAMRFLARAQLLAGDIETAIENMNSALHIIEQTGERIWEIDLYRLRGLAGSAAGNSASAERDFEQALTLSRQNNTKSWELRVSMDLARFRADQGKVREAHTLLHECYAWFTEGFDTPDLQRARSLLDELA